MSNDTSGSETLHSNRYECPECGNSIWLDWYDGDGAVSQMPKVECGNIDCDGGRMVLCD